MDRVTLNPLKSIKFHEYASNNKQNTFHWEKFLRKESVGWFSMKMANLQWDVW